VIVVVSTTAPPPPVPTGQPTVTIQDLSASARTNVPATFGYVFAPGYIPSGQYVTTASGVPLQVDTKARHTDGSLRHAVITLRVPSLASSGSNTVRFLPTTTPPASGSVVPLADLLNGGFDAAVSLTVGSTPYTVSASDLLRQATPATWLAGPLVTEWKVSGPLRAGTSAHPHLQAIFHVRAYAGMDSVRVDVALENNWAFEPGQQNISYGNFAVTVGGSTVYSRTTLNHYSQSRWRKLFWWRGDPNVHVVHDKNYLMSTGAVPTYDPAITVVPEALTQIRNGWQGAAIEPMGRGLFSTDYMPGTGGRPDIGLLPGWDVVYLMSGDYSVKVPAFGTSDLAGSQPVHYRDKLTGNPASLDSYPYMFRDSGNNILIRDTRTAANGVCGGSCGTPYTPDSDHQPAVAYVPYLLSGDYYYLEELQFWANWNLLNMNPDYRANGQGIMNANQTRGNSWALRTLGQAAYATPDSHPLKSYFVVRMRNNIAWYTDEYPRNLRGNTNNLGIVTNGYAFIPVNNAYLGVSPWQDDFFTSTINHIYSLGFAEAKALLDWKTKFSVERMISSQYCWIYAPPYNLNVRTPAAAAADSRQVYSTLGEAYAATADPRVIGLPCGGQQMASILGLAVGETVGSDTDPESYTANLQTALAAAVDAGYPGANDAWTKFRNRPIAFDYRRNPTYNFAIVPRGSP
jgi:hypothetical protein